MDNSGTGSLFYGFTILDLPGFAKASVSGFTSFRLRQTYAATRRRDKSPWPQGMY
ncbi:MAG: hypothetical protein IKT79_01940 [Akkermansia sp.]|nr:hypothetical protein [Akkermansia sp.]